MPDPAIAETAASGVNERSRVKMSAAEVSEYLADGTATASCATLNRDRTVHLVAMSYAYLDGHVHLEAKEKSQKIVNLRRDPRITCLVADGTDYRELRGVQLVGRAVIIDDHDYVFNVLVDVLQRYTTFRLSDDNRSTVERAMRNRVAVKIEPTRVITWDHHKLDGADRRASA